MTVEQFRQSVSAASPPTGLDRSAQAMWYAAKGDWHAAHRLAQEEESATGAWVHAYLHRLEGDASNAQYWYRRAGKPVSSESLAAEWESIVSFLLAR
jgi:hypothetical protein